MWLLSTDHAELRYFNNNFDATGGYAILSHTWDGDEQTLQEVRAIGERCRPSGTNPREDPKLSSKIRECCILAEKHGYHWVWIDSCCIDKTSSSELSEAINSMFRWYKEAEVCFAYLKDVPTGSKDELKAPESPFRTSRWHTRGWTLQELIAPDFLIFLSAHWHELGNRADLAGLLSEITRVPSGILTGEAQPGHFSVCVRMSWASKRKTTRVEDEAYCLMGLFGVSLPTNYGEGKKAFLRLQYEIMHHDPDMSLFAFGYCVDQDRSRAVTFHPEEKINNPWQYLMAYSPREFDSLFTYIPDLGTKVKQPYPPPLHSKRADTFNGGVELPRASVTSYGVKLRVPIREVGGITIAVILCQHHGKNIGLFLTKDNRGKDPTRPRYFTGCHYTKSETRSARYAARLVNLGDDLSNLTFNKNQGKASWRTIYIVPTASDLDSGKWATPNLIMNCNPTSHFRVPRWLIARFTALQFEVTQPRNDEALQVLSLFLPQRVQIYVSLGSCTQHNDDLPNKPRPVWAKVDVLLDHLEMHDFLHVCSEDHIDSSSWASQSKFFGDADRGVQLSLTPSSWTPNSSHVVHLELSGHVLAEMLQDSRNAPLFPSLAALKRDTPPRC